MSYFKVKFKSIIKETESGICFERWNDKGIVWLPKRYIELYSKYQRSLAIVMPGWLYRDKQLKGKKVNLFHHPKKIAPIYNQEALDELKC